MFPVEYILGEMFLWQRIKKAKQSDVLWASQHVTGSRAEGLSIPLSILHNGTQKFSVLSTDLDIMIVKRSFGMYDTIPIFDVRHVQNDRRYVKLRLTETYKKENKDLSNSVFLSHVNLLTPTIFGITYDESGEGLHGPARKARIEIARTFELTVDKSEVLEYPKSAVKWLWLEHTHERVWPSSAVVQQICDSGCHLAPVGRGKRASEAVHRKEDLVISGGVDSTQSQKREEEIIMDETEWRISFSFAEDILGQSLSPMQRHVLVLLKIIKKAFLSDHDVISTYHLKNIFFWECENREINFWREDNSAACVLSVLDRLEDCLEKCHLRHYIMPESNLLQYEDPDKLSKAAEAVRGLRENAFQKTVNVLKTLQVTMFQSRHYFHDFHNFEPLLLKGQMSDITNVEMSELMCSFLQLLIDKYKEIIADELGKDYETIKQQMTSAFDNFLWLIDDFSQVILNFLFRSQISLTSYEDVSSRMESIVSGIDRAISDILELTDSERESDLGHVYSFLSLLQELAAGSLKCFDLDVFANVLKYVDLPPEKEDLGFTMKTASQLLRFTDLKDSIINLRNLIELYFSNISPLRLCVHESILARIYCNLWFKKNGKTSDHSKSRKAFRRLVSDDIKNCSLNEEFIKLSLTFFDKMAEGRDASQIVSETNVFKKVKEIQEKLALETFNVMKSYCLWIKTEGNEVFNEISKLLEGVYSG